MIAEYRGQLYLVEYKVETRPKEQSFYRIDLETDEVYEWEPFSEIIGVSEAGEHLYFYYHEEYRKADGYTFYSVNHIYRIKKDGTEKEELYEWKEDEQAYAGYHGNIKCVGEWIVYLNRRDGKIYRMDQRGKRKMQLPIEREIGQLSVWEDKIYYMDIDGQLYGNDVSGENEYKIN